MEPNQNPASVQNNRLVPIAIIIAGLFVAAAIYFGGGRAPVQGSLTGNNTAPAAGAVGVVAPVTAKDHILGDPNAQIVIVEYSDLECPFCKVFQATLHQVMLDYPGKVAWVFRQFPIAQLHPKAPNEAAAAECAFDQGGNTIFWKYIDQVFATTNSNNSLDPAQLPLIAQNLGLDLSAFNNCLSSGTHTADIQADVVAAGKAGANGTPYSVIITKDGQKIPIDGAEPIDQVESTINGLLK
jgi:protein-disulfide isomerase